VTLTDIVVGLVTVLLLAYEAWTIVNKTPNDTESEAVRWAAVRQPITSFFAGLLVGHWFIPRCGSVEPEYAAPLLIIAAWFGLLWLHQSTVGRRIAAGFAWGLVTGYIFWPLCVGAEQALRSLHQ
jgi:hypothetical protein